MITANRTRKTSFGMYQNGSDARSLLLRGCVVKKKIGGIGVAILVVIVPILLTGRQTGSETRFAVGILQQQQAEDQKRLDQAQRQASEAGQQSALTQKQVGELQHELEELKNQMRRTSGGPGLAGRLGGSVKQTGNHAVASPSKQKSKVSIKDGRHAHRGTIPRKRGPILLLVCSKPLVDGV